MAKRGGTWGKRLVDPTAPVVYAAGGHRIVERDVKAALENLGDEKVDAYLDGTMDQAEAYRLAARYVETLRVLGRRVRKPRETDEFLTVAQVARRYQVHEETVRKWVRAEAIRYVRLGPHGLIRIRASDVVEFCGRGAEKPPSAP